MITAVCKNPWCKAHYQYEESVQTPPSICYKCQSFESELSGGVSWSEKKYEGSRFDGQPHPIKVNVSRATEQKKSW